LANILQRTCIQINTIMLHIKNKRNALKRFKTSGIFLGLLSATLLLGHYATDTTQKSLQHGPMNTGHEKLLCEDCHTKTEGSLRQQLQAKIKFSLGQRKTDICMGTNPVNNAACVNCHSRPNDRHPAARFEEPRFAQARVAIQPTECKSCHQEHKGVRVVGASDYCSNCHQDTKLENDPLDVPHAQLIQSKNWKTCLQCHDFHGNHIAKTPTFLKDTIPNAFIEAYFKGGKSPYSENKKYKTKGLN
jgi:Cytochrome c3